MKIGVTDFISGAYGKDAVIVQRLYYTEGRQLVSWLETQPKGGELAFPAPPDNVANLGASVGQDCPPE
jgi:hypothetical protein